MKAIETKWKGYRFRSRTEARWAVFFEAAGIDFEYEPEGYVLPSGPYLPDFRLRTFGDGRTGKECVAGEPLRVIEKSTFIEVKGTMPTAEEIQRCGELQEHLQATVTGFTEVFIAVGSPDTTRRVFPVCGVWDGNDRRLGDYQIFDDEPGCFATAGLDGEIGLSMESAGPGGADWLLCSIGHRTRGDALRPFSVEAATIPAWMQVAYDAARSARFEFGQTDQRWDT